MSLLLICNVGWLLPILLRNKQCLKRYIQCICTFSAYYTRKEMKTRWFIILLRSFWLCNIFLSRNVLLYNHNFTVRLSTIIIARWIEWHIHSCFVFSVRGEHFVVQDVAVVFFLLKFSSERVFWSKRKILQYMCSNTVI